MQKTGRGGARSSEGILTSLKVQVALAAIPDLGSRQALSNNIVQHVARHVGQAEIAAAVLIGELGVIDAHQVKNRGVQVVQVAVTPDGRALILAVSDVPWRSARPHVQQGQRAHRV